VVVSKAAGGLVCVDAGAQSYGGAFDTKFKKGTANVVESEETNESSRIARWQEETSQQSN
jgi:hypothetical protein